MGAQVPIGCLCSHHNYNEEHVLKKNFNEILVEFVVLALCVGFIPELSVGAVTDTFGVCLSAIPEVCSNLQIQGVIKAVGALICSVASVLVAFTLSKQYNKYKG